MVILLLAGIGLLIASAWKGNLIGPGLASVVAAIWLWPHIAPLI